MFSDDLKNYLIYKEKAEKQIHKFINIYGTVDKEIKGYSQSFFLDYDILSFYINDDQLVIKIEYQSWSGSWYEKLIFVPCSLLNDIESYKKYLKDKFLKEEEKRAVYRKEKELQQEKEEKAQYEKLKAKFEKNV